MTRALYIILLVAILASCKSDTQTPTDSADLSQVELASDKDPICGMPISPQTANDTLATAEGVYGFCCEGCKEEYVTQMASN